MREACLVFPMTDEHVCLAMKKRGFGAGKYNGAGGKREEGETVAQTAVREIGEELCLNLSEDDLRRQAELFFYFDEQPELNFHTHVFTTRVWRGEPQETEEMRPRWFRRDEVPFDEMWSDDPFWLPDVLSDNFVIASFYFHPDGETVRTYEKEVQNLE